MRKEILESLVETLELMADRELTSGLCKGMEEMRQGKGVPWEKVKKKLGL